MTLILRGLRASINPGARHGDGGALFLLWPLACVAMMVAMMWGMGAMSRRPQEHTHDDGVTHSHEDIPVQTRK